MSVNVLTEIAAEVCLCVGSGNNGFLPLTGDLSRVCSWLSPCILWGLGVGIHQGWMDGWMYQVTEH